MYAPPPTSLIPHLVVQVPAFSGFCGFPTTKIQIGDRESIFSKNNLKTKSDMKFPRIVLRATVQPEPCAYIFKIFELFSFTVSMQQSHENSQKKPTTYRQSCAQKKTGNTQNHDLKTMLARPKCETFPTVQQKTSNYVVAVTCQSDDALGPYCIMLHFLLRKSKQVGKL